MFDVIAVYIAVVDAVMLPHKNAVGLLPADVSDVFFLFENFLDRDVVPLLSGR